MNMPIVHIDQIELTPDERKIAEGIINPRTGQLRASCPPMPKKKEYPARPGDHFRTYFDYEDDAGKLQGERAYVWRHVAFSISPISQHQCMPCTDFCYLADYGGSAQRRAREKELQALVDKIVKQGVPPTEWHGVARWGRALGYGG